MRHILQKLVINEQIQDEWCWAAVAVGIAQFYGAPTLTQCQVATRRFPGNDCCSNGSTLPCNAPVLLESVLPKEHFNQPKQPPLSPNSVLDEIRKMHPLCIRVKFPDDDAHFAVIKGIDDSDFQLLVSDPEFGECWHPFAVVQSSYKGAGMWVNSFLTM